MIEDINGYNGYISSCNIVCARERGSLVTGGMSNLYDGFQHKSLSFLIQSRNGDFTQCVDNTFLSSSKLIVWGTKLRKDFLHMSPYDSGTCPCICYRNMCLVK